MIWAGDIEAQKLPKFTTELKLIGKYLIFLPQNVGHIYARGLTDIKKIEVLVNKYKDFGLIFRSSIDSVDDIGLIEQEFDFLVQSYHSAKSSEIKQITQPVYKFLQLIRESQLDFDIQIVTNNQEIYSYLLPYSKLWSLNSININTDLLPSDAIGCKLVSSTEFDLEINVLSGISLIDINSKTKALNFYQVNYLSVDEIIRQIYLRDITGIILLDFIKNMSQTEENKILEKLVISLKIDWRRTRVLGFTKAGICEIIRNK